MSTPLPGRDDLITLGAALLMGLFVGVARVARERGEQVVQGAPLTPLYAVAADVIYAALGGEAVVLFGSLAFDLPFKAQLGLAMLGSSLGPSVWDFVAKLATGEIKLALNQKKEDKNP